MIHKLKLVSNQDSTNKTLSLTIRMYKMARKVISEQRITFLYLSIYIHIYIIDVEKGDNRTN